MQVLYKTLDKKLDKGSEEMTEEKIKAALRAVKAEYQFEMKKRGLTQRKIAMMLGIEESQVSQAVGGNSGKRMEEIRAEIRSILSMED